MHNGFYNRKEKGEIFFNCMTEESSGKYEDLSLYDFLHGDCPYFAGWLAQKYNYPMWTITFLYKKSENGYWRKWDNSIIHSFCTTSYKDKIYYIDARGITDNSLNFISEFLDVIAEIEKQCKEKGYQYKIDYKMYNSFDKYLKTKKDFNVKTFLEAHSLEEKYADIFDFEKFKKAYL